MKRSSCVVSFFLPPVSFASLFSLLDFCWLHDSIWLVTLHLRSVSVDAADFSLKAGVFCNRDTDLSTGASTATLMRHSLVADEISFSCLLNVT